VHSALDALDRQHQRDEPRKTVQTALLRWPMPGLASQTGAVIRSNVASCTPAGYRFPREVIAVAVRWYLRYGLSYRDVEGLLTERGIEVDHVTIYRWVQALTPQFIDAARPARHAAGDRWFLDETYVKVAGHWIYLYRAVDQHGQVIDVLVSPRRNGAAARSFFDRALRLGPEPRRGCHRPGAGLPTDTGRNGARGAAHHRAVREQLHRGRPWSVQGKTAADARTQTPGLCAHIAAGHAFVQNLRRGHYALSADLPIHDRVRVAFDDLALSL
jgi:transposase InsO family protein